MELARSSRTGLDMRSEVELLSYVNLKQQDVVARVQLGSDAQPIAGNGNYVLRIYVSGVRMLPESSVAVAAGLTKVVSSSRPVLADAGETISVRVLGGPSDSSVAAVTILQDATPATLSELSGPGPVQVDHDYGGADALSYADQNTHAGVAGADVRAFLKSDYDAGNRSNGYVVGRTTTATGGRWSRPLMLDPGTYVLVYFKQGPNGYGPDAVTLVVT